MATKTYESQTKGVKIDVDEEACKGLNECVEVCPTNVFDLVEGKAVAARIDECIECCQCVDVCPEGAIKHSAC